MGEPVSEIDSVMEDEAITELELEEFEEVLPDASDEAVEDDTLDLADVVDANAVVTEEVDAEVTPPAAKAEDTITAPPTVKQVSPEPDIFRTTIVDVGDKKFLKLSVEELGQKHPKSLIWVAEGLVVNDRNRERYGKIQEVCRKWLEAHPEARERAAEKTGGAA
jgi:hypothetical protein